MDVARQASSVRLLASERMPERYADPPGGPAYEPAATLVPGQVAPLVRPDGLVAVRPDDPAIEYDDPMWQSYSWVAMLDPVELSHDVRVADLRTGQVAGRPVWRATLTTLTALGGYRPRCGGNCCELLWSRAGLLADFADDVDRIPEDWRARSYPDAYDVALDLQAGVVVRCHPVGRHPTAPWMEVDILAVDADLDDLFPDQ